MKYLSVFSVLLLTASLSTPLAAFEVDIDAYSAWKFAGQAIPSSKSDTAMVGTFQGPVLIEKGDGLHDGGFVACTSNLTIDSLESSIDGDGSCVISHAEGQRVYGQYECQGSVGHGCVGNFEVTGGEGGFEEATGSGRFLIRTLLAGNEDVFLGNIVEYGVGGLAIWRDFKLSVPEVDASASSDAQ